MNDPVRVRCCEEVAERLREPEVADLGPAVAVEEAVRGLHVAVEDAELMRLGQPLHDLDDPRHGLFRGQGAAVLDEVLERRAGHQLHHDVRPAPVLVGREDEHAPRVGDRAGEPPLLAEPLDGVGRVEVPRGDQLERDLPADLLVLGLEDRAHPAAAKRPDQPIAGDALREVPGAAIGTIAALVDDGLADIGGRRDRRGRRATGRKRRRSAGVRRNNRGRVGTSGRPAAWSDRPLIASPRPGPTRRLLGIRRGSRGQIILERAALVTLVFPRLADLYPERGFPEPGKSRAKGSRPRSLP